MTFRPPATASSTEDLVVRRRAAVASAPVDGSVLVYDAARESAHLLNPTAAAIWELIDGERDPRTITTELARQFATEPATISDDVHGVLAELTELGVIGTGADRAPLDGRPGAEPDPGGSREPVSPAPGHGGVMSRPFDALGFAFDITAPPELVSRFTASFRSLETTRPADHHYVLAPRPAEVEPDQPPGADLWFDGEPAHAGPMTLTAGFLLWHVNNQAVGAVYDGLLIHSTAVLTERGVVAFVGTMDAGKSTLVAALTRRGHAYVTDEAVAVVADPDRTKPLMVESYPKPIGLDPGSWSLFPELGAVAHPDVDARWWLDPTALTPDAIAVPNRSMHPLGAIVFIQYRPGTSTTLVALDPADAALALTGNLFNLAADPPHGLVLVARVAQEQPCFRLDIGDLGGAASEIDGLIARLG